MWNACSPSDHGLHETPGAFYKNEVQMGKLHINYLVQLRIWNVYMLSVWKSD